MTDFLRSLDIAAVQSTRHQPPTMMTYYPCYLKSPQQLVGSALELNHRFHQHLLRLEMGQKRHGYRRSVSQSRSRFYRRLPCLCKCRQARKSAHHQLQITNQ